MSSKGDDNRNKLDEEEIVKRTEIDPHKPIHEKRNIGIIAHIDAGKTTTTERILFYTGITDKIGEVHDGKATMDFMKQEQDRGITIQSAATTVFWRSPETDKWLGRPNYMEFNIIDTPGHVDFTIEVERSLKVLDGAVCVLDAANGPEAQTGTVWRQSNRHGVPRMIFINKIDKNTANFKYSIEGISKKLSSSLFILQIPVGSGSSFSGIIDVIRMKFLRWSGVCGERYAVENISDDLMNIAKDGRDALINALLVNAPYQMSEDYISNGDIPNEEIEKEIRRQTIGLLGFPVLCGSAYKNTGVETLLDAVVKYLPNPSEKLVKTAAGDVVNCDPKGPLVALIFKIVKDPFAGTLMYIRIYSGTLQKGMDYKIARTGQTVRFSSISIMRAAERNRVSLVCAGSIATITAQDEFTTGDTMTTDVKYALTGIVVPPKVLSASIKPKNKSDINVLLNALNILVREDPSFSYENNSDTNSVVIFGMGELHLDVKVTLLKEQGIEVDVGRPVVRYRETIKAESCPIKFSYEHKKQSGGKGQYAKIDFRVEAMDDSNSPNEFKSEIFGASVREAFFKDIWDGIQESCESGPQTKSPVTGLKFVLYDGKEHCVDSDALSFYLAGKYFATDLLKNALQEGKMELLEPMVSIEVTNVSVAVLGDVAGLLAKKGGVITEQSSEINNKDTHNSSDSAMYTIAAQMPLENTLGLITELRAKTQGLATYTQEPNGYRKVSEHRAKLICAEKGFVS